MAQFDVHPNPGKLKGVIPYVVVVQSAVFDHSDRRVVAPLVLAREFGRVQSKRFNPTFRVSDIDVVMQPLEIVSVPKGLLGRPVDNLKAKGQLVIDALDELMSQAYG
jgi:toxin CcdB